MATTGKAKRPVDGMGSNVSKPATKDFAITARGANDSKLGSRATAVGLQRKESTASLIGRSLREGKIPVEAASSRDSAYATNARGAMGRQKVSFGGRTGGVAASKRPLGV